MSDGSSFEIEDALPFKVSALSLIADREITSPSIVISPIFSEFSFVSLFVFVSGVGPKREVLGDVSDFVKFGFFGLRDRKSVV